MNPAVSVITPAYNVEGYIGRAIDSVLAQTYQDFEIVVVDDGSTDGTPRVLERYASAHPGRVRILTQANSGPSAARNRAFREARGRLFAFLDSDDEWLPSFLAEQMQILGAHPDVAVVTGNAIVRGGAGDGRPARPFPDPRPEPNLAEILRDENAVFIMAVFRRDVVDRIGGFDESLITNEDYDFWIRAARAGFRFARNDRPLGYYRRLTNSLSSSELRMIAGILPVFQKALSACGADAEARRIIDRQVTRFERELATAQARAALDAGAVDEARRSIAEWRSKGGGRVAALLDFALRVAPDAALHLYRFRQKHRRLVAET